MSGEMKGTYEVTLGEETKLVHVRKVPCGREGCESYEIRIGEGEPVVVEATHPEQGVLSVLIGHRTYECGIDPTDEGVDVEVLGQHHEVEVIDPRRKALRMAGAAGGAVVKTSMPGRVVRLLVEAGAAVKKGEALLVVEAMKMENEMKAPRDGVVKRFAVAEGDLVEAKAVLVELE